MSHRLLVAACLLALAEVHAAEIHAAAAQTFFFDMGTAESELRPGFTRITAQSVYGKEIGYGWQSAEGLREQAQSYSRKWEINESRGSSQPPPIYTNEITCDCVTGKRPNAMLVDVAPGDYTIYLLCGQSAGSARDYHVFDIAAGGQTAGVKIPGPYRFEKRVLRASTADGRLAIEFRPETDWLVACLAIFPTVDEPTVRKNVLDPLEQEVYFLPPDVAETWKETKHVDDRPLPDLSPADRARGYAIFARHYTEIIYPNTVPRQDELDPELSIFASLGEYEPVTFTLCPQQDVNDVCVVAGDLRSGDSAIAKENVDVRYVRYMLVRPNYSLFNAYHVAPDVLEHRPNVDLRSGYNQRCWVTVRVPEDATPGVYEGGLSVLVGGKPTGNVPLRVRVLPIRLRTDPEHVYGMYYRDPLSQVSESNTPQANEYFQRKAELERRDMVAHGMNCHISGVSGLDRDEQGNWTMDGAETERRIALDRKYGLADRPLVVSFPVDSWYSRLVDKQGTGSHLRLVRADVPESFFDEVTKMVQAIEQEKKKYDWPEFLYYPIDEPSTSEASVRFMVGVLRAIKRAPGVRTYVTADPSKDQFEPMRPYVDVWCCQPFVFGHEKIRQLSRGEGTPWQEPEVSPGGNARRIGFWCYPNHISGENDHTPVAGARMTWGYGFWKSGFKALIPWIYQASSGDPWNYLDGSSMDFFNRSTPEGEPIPVAMWEAYREGIDDGRYVYTLRQLIDAARQEGGPAAAAADSAQRELQSVWDAIEVQEKYKYDGLWTGPDFDAYRWLLASNILELQKGNRP